MTKHQKIKNQLLIYKPKGRNVEVEVKVEKETIWLDAHQMGKVFGVNRPAVVKHINNIYKAGELSKDSTCSILEQVAADGKVRKMNLYNLDMIIAVGYRVNSFRATQFRIWATQVLRNYLLRGYVVNEKKMLSSRDTFKNLQETIKLLHKKIDHPLLAGQEKEILDFLSTYANTLTLLNEYDQGKIKEIKGTKSRFRLSYKTAKKLISQLKSELDRKCQVNELFGVEQARKLEAIIKNLYQTFGRKSLYPTIEDKTANLLYFIIKDHPFVDGNKRIGAMLFIYFLDKSDYLYRSNNERKFNDNALTTLCLLIAISDPKEKDKMIEITKNLVCE